MKSMRSLLLTLLLATPTAAQVKVCPSTAASDTITIAGSTLVQTIANSWGAAYTAQCKAKVTVEGGGSTDGAKRVCGDTSKGAAVDIGTMSRAWKSTEAAVSTNGFTYQCAIGAKPKVIQIDVAIDGLTMILKRGSLPDVCIKALGGLTVQHLRWMFSSYTSAKLAATGWPLTTLANSDKNDKTHLFSELSSSCPKTEIKLVGLNSTFATYTYFLETIFTDFANGETFDILRPNGAAFKGTRSENATIALVKGDTNTIGFVSYSNFDKARTIVNAVSIKNKAGFIVPTTATFAAGTYPLSRRVFMNLLSSTVDKTKAFIEYGMSVKGTANVSSNGFSPIPTSSRATQKAKLQIA